MSSECLNLIQDEDEDVILEGSDLYQALTNMGFTNFDSMPRVKEEPDSFQIELSPVKEYRSINQNLCDKVDSVCSYILQEDKLRENQIKAILQSEILLDDHTAAINDFLIVEKSSYLRNCLGWIPILGSAITAISPLVVGRKKSIAASIMTLTIFSISAYTKSKHWFLVRNLKHLIKLQNDLHNLLKQSLKILRRIYGRKSINEVHEQEKLVGSEKQNIILSIKTLLSECLDNLSVTYYAEASQILSTFPDTLRLNCTLTNIETECEQSFDCNSYEKLKSLYYTFLLVQSETMFIMANAYNGRIQDTIFRVPKSNLSCTVQNLNKSLTISYLKMSKIMQTYQLCEVKPIQRVFRGIPTSKWHDTYIHLDLTSQRIELAYKEIISILECLDLYSEKDEESDLQLAELITEKINETYKQIENARSFAEFSSLLIAKAQRKPGNIPDHNENENQFPNNFDNRKIIMIDKDLEIEDEVFEEYIKEEYLKPLYENSDENTIENFRLDKLLEKNFMSELKDALIEKQKSMTERELKALKRMYEKVQKDTTTSSKTESDICPIPEKSIETEEPVAPTSVPPPPQPPLPPPPPPPPPPRVLENTIIAENYVEEEEREQKKVRTPIPLPRVKMLKPEDEIADVQRFSINQCTPIFKFPTLRLTEETFIGSGENSEAEEEDDDDDLESNSDNDDGNSIVEI